MHWEQTQFCLSIRDLFPHYFRDSVVLDVGSQDINGCNRGLFTNSRYLGIDVGPGPNVDCVCQCHQFAPGYQFDTIISTECFEHDAFYCKSLVRITELLRPRGLFLFTCATTGRPEHGTCKTSLVESPFTGDYYRNLTEQDIRQCIDVEQIFRLFEFDFRTDPCDLYFWGIKRFES